MSDRCDVAVIGRGVAGTLAALAARSRGAHVVVVAAGGGATELGSGAWDLWGTHTIAPDAETSIVEHARAKGPAHADALLLTLAQAQELLGGLLLHVSGSMPLVPTEAGILRRAAALDSAQLDLSRKPAAIVAIASLSGHPSFDAQRLAVALDAQAVDRKDARRFTAVEVDFFRRGRDRVLHPHELAAALDAEAPRELFLRAVRRALGGLRVDALLLPPVLGIETDVRGWLEQRLGVAVGEIVPAQAGALGVRTRRRLDRALERTSIATIAARVESVERRGGDLVICHDRGELRARRLILATGKVLGGGLVVRDDGSLRDGVLGLDVESGQAAGLAVDDTGRVLGLPAALARAAVWACGEVTRGLDARSGLVAVAHSGLQAGYACADPAALAATRAL